MNFVIAFAISLASSIFLYSTATLIHAPADVAKAVGTLPMLGLKNIYEYLEARKAKRQFAEGNTPDLANPDRSGIGVIVMLPLMVLLIAAMMLVTGSLMGILVSVSAALSGVRHLFQLDSVFAIELIIMTAFPIRVAIAAYVGRWAGMRSARHGILIAASAGPLGAALAYVVGLGLLVPDDLRTKMATMVNAGLLPVLIDGAVYGAIAALAAFFGQRRREARQLALLLRILPPDTRRAVVDLAREEAVRAAAHA